MELFRITKAEFAQELFAPGFPGRWNRSGEEVIYAASSRSLACLENLVHRRSTVGTSSFKTVVIYVPDHLAIQHVNLKDLPDQWNQSPICKICQELGSDWYRSQESLTLKVPSAVVPDEFNYMLNTHHSDFKKIKIADVLPFYFGKRL